MDYLDRRSYRHRRRVLKDRTAVYHVMCRTVRKQFWLGDAEREMFRRMMEKQAAFAGVEVLTYCLMGNHLHLLVRVPECPLKTEGEHLIGDVEILRRYEGFYGERVPKSTYSLKELKAAFAQGGSVAEKARRTVLARMGDLSAFMKELKQRFGIWLNDRCEMQGTIWSDRFKSVLVENETEVLTRVAAYIDLNPVRAGMVGDPKDYRWSGYGAAMRGSTFARQGLTGLWFQSAKVYDEVIRLYRLVIYGKGELAKEGACKVDTEAVQRVLEAGGKVSAVEVLRCRMAELSESIALGSETFVSACQQALATGRPVKQACWRGWERFQRKMED